MEWSLLYSNGKPPTSTQVAEYIDCSLWSEMNHRLQTVYQIEPITEEPIIEIAFEANYDSQQAFTLAFRQLYGHPPKEYRAIKIHIPKINKFKQKSNLVLHYKATMKCEVIAA